MGDVGICGGSEEALEMEVDELRAKVLGDRLAFVLS